MPAAVDPDQLDAGQGRIFVTPGLIRLGGGRPAGTSAGLWCSASLFNARAKSSGGRRDPNAPPGGRAPDPPPPLQARVESCVWSPVASGPVAAAALGSGRGCLLGTSSPPAVP